MAKFYTPTKISENIRETPEGYLLCIGVPIARTGWQVYADGETPLKVGPDGTVRVYRSPEEVFRPETIASFQGKPSTIRHPEDFVGPKNWHYLSKGTMQNVRRGTEKDEDGEENLVADLLITDEMAINLVKNGLREVSCGYECEYEQTGEGEGRQYNIVGNHIALVEQGRAGPSYAIVDHKGKVTMKPNMIEKLKARFGAKAVDEAMAEEPAKESKDAASYDELMKAVKDLSAKIDSMGKGKDEEKPEPKKEDAPAAKDEEKPSEEKKEESKDEESEEPKLEERLKALEAAVAKLLESKAGDEKSEESEEEENETLTGDTAARVEILAPGLKVAKKEDAKKKALETAFASQDGKAVLEMLTGDKKLVLDSADKINHLFIATSEILKAQRGTGLEGSKNPIGFYTGDSKTEVMTPEKMNEMNAAHYGKK